MSLSGVPLDLKVTFDGSTDVEGKLHQVIIRAIKLAMKDTVKYMQTIVPEAEAAFFRYPSSYFAEESEELMVTAITALQTHVNMLSRAGQLREEYRVPVEFPASYAKYVNESQTTGVWSEKGDTGWSKSGSESHFYEKTVAFFRARYCYHQKVILGIKAVMDANIDELYYRSVKGGIGPRG